MFVDLRSIAIALGVVGVVALALIVTHSGWTLLGLIFLVHARPVSVRKQCPKCGHEFVNKEADTENKPVQSGM